MVISRTSAVLDSIQAVSPLSIFGGASSANAGAAARMADSRAQNPHDKRGRFIAIIPLVPCNGSRSRSKRGGVGFAGPDAHRSFHVEDENLAVTDFVGAG